MVRVHPPEQGQQTLVADDQLPGRLDHIEVLEVFLKEIVVPHIFNKPLIGVVFEKALKLIKIVPKHGLGVFCLEFVS